jgi:hypothetical protein
MGKDASDAARVWGEIYEGIIVRDKSDLAARAAKSYAGEAFSFRNRYIRETGGVLFRDRAIIEPGKSSYLLHLARYLLRYTSATF